MRKPPHREQLIHILQAAYSGELAAAYAYRGHWKSVTDPIERASIQQIENDEWVHRQRVGLMLESLGARPLNRREIRMWVTGRTVGVLCHVTGRFLPMYFAGRLEGRNVEEYETAARHAGALGLNQFESELRVMRSVERKHEQFFLDAVTGHRLLRFVRSIFKWGWPEGGAHPGDAASVLEPRLGSEAYEKPLASDGD